MPSRLYLGPYNDPAGWSGKRHWDVPHDPDFANPAIRVDLKDGTYTVNVSVGNRDTVETSPNDVTVQMFAIGLPSLFTPDGLHDLAMQLLAGTIPSQIPPGIQTSFTVGDPGVPPFSPCFDRCWSAGPVAFTLAGKGILLVAKLTSQKWTLQPTVAAEIDPCVAVWVGP